MTSTLFGENVVSIWESLLVMKNVFHLVNGPEYKLKHICNFLYKGSTLILFKMIACSKIKCAKLRGMNFFRSLCWCAHYFELETKGIYSCLDPKC